MKLVYYRRTIPFVNSGLSLVMSLALFIMLLFAMTASAHAVNPPILFIDKDASGPTHDGLSWATAYTNVQDALDWTRIYTTTPYELWVAEGVYYPDVGGAHIANAVTETFHIQYDNVRLYGGFAATETARTQRNWVAHPTILSGDIDGNDSNADGNFIAESPTAVQGSNAYHVLYIGGGAGDVTGATVIDGIIITAGNADNQMTYRGGGIFCHGNGRSCSPALAHLVISGNSGSGMFNLAEHRASNNPTLTGVVFRGNATTTSGGGMMNYANQSAVNPTLTNVIFHNNSARSDGGGMNNMAFEGSSSPTLINVLFSGNRAGSLGGGLYTAAGGNFAESSPTMINVTFGGNDAGSTGGAIFSFGDESSGGEGSFVMALSNPVLINCIVWGNGGTEQITDWRPGVFVRVWDSIVQGGLPGTSALDADPRFVAPVSASNAPTVTGNYRLLPDSPAIDAGSTLSVPAEIATDLNDYARVVNGVVELGAYEVQRFGLALRGDGQSAPVSSTFTLPLEAIVSSGFGDAVGPGLVLTFTPPAAGPGVSVAVPFTLATDAAGGVSTAATANGIAGSYVVTVATRGETPPQLFNLTNSRLPTTVDLVSAPNPARLETPFVLTATVTAPGSSLPGGEVVFADAGGALQFTTTLAAGRAVTAVSGLPPGIYHLTAAYLGDATHAPGASAVLAQTVRAPAAPYARADASALLQGGSLLVDVLANDRSGDSPLLSVVQVTQPESGAAVLEQNRVRFTPPAGFTGSSTFSYTLQDGNGLESSAGVVVTVVATENSNGEPQTEPLLDPAAGASMALVTAAGGTWIEVPAGAIASPSPLAAYTLIYQEIVSPQPPPPGTVFRFGGRAFVLDLFVDSVRQAGYTFGVPIRITLDYSPALGPDPSQLSLVYYDEQAGRWLNEGIRVLGVDEQKHTFTVSVTHLTQFAAGSWRPTNQYTLYLPVIDK